MPAKVTRLGSTAPEDAPEPNPDNQPEVETPGEVEFEEDTDGPDPFSDEDEESVNLPTLEQADPNDHLWEGGPTVGEAVAYKQEHGEIYVTTVTMEKFILWKTMLRHEYAKVVRTIEQLNAQGELSPTELNMIQEELICELCFLHPKMAGDDFQKELAGIPSLLSQQILESSGFTAIDTRGL